MVGCGAGLDNRLCQYHKIFTTNFATLDLVPPPSLLWICFESGELCGRKNCGAWLSFAVWRNGSRGQPFPAIYRLCISPPSIEPTKTSRTPCLWRNQKMRWLWLLSAPGPWEQQAVSEQLPCQRDIVKQVFRWDWFFGGLL